MIRALLHRTIAAFERRYDYDAAYMHEILDTSVGAFVKLAMAQSMNLHRAGVPSDALFAARIAAVRFEDCGPCAQLTVNMAREAGVPAATVRAIVARDFTRLSPDVALALRFTDAVLAHADADALRRDARTRWGHEGLVTLAYSIAAVRTYPTMKRVLGHAHTCERLSVDGESVIAAHAA
jgi:alkylhydroperoxidase family enzyme